MRSAVLIVVLLAAASASATYVLSETGQSCAAACGAQGLSCQQHVVTDNTTSLFAKLGVTCKPGVANWWAADQPSYVADKGDENYGLCLGFANVPINGSCQATYWSVRRLCQCGQDISSRPLFGTGLSAGTLTTNETVIFAHKIPSGKLGVMTHYWTTAPPHSLDDAIVRYYVDGETTASIAFAPGMAAGVGFGDDGAPRGTKWFGIGAGGSGGGAAYFNNFRIPFGESIRITVQHKTHNVGGFYMIVRGMLTDQLSIGGVALPKNARLRLQVQQKLLAPLERLTVTDVLNGAGMHFMSVLAAQSGNLNFLEGCYHAYAPYNESWPGTVLSTGTEDYFDSGWYFDAGQFYFPVSGFTHMNNTKNNVTWSAYRFHETDPLLFDDGFRLEWRNGDMTDPHTGLKCFTETGGNVVGSPTATTVLSYAWVYLW